MVITVGLDDTCRAFKAINEGGGFMAYVVCISFSLSVIYTLFPLHAVVRTIDMPGAVASAFILLSTLSGYVRDQLIALVIDVTFGFVNVCMGSYM